jgi:hypothetical protein
MNGLPTRMGATTAGDPVWLVFGLLRHLAFTVRLIANESRPSGWKIREANCIPVSVY